LAVYLSSVGGVQTSTAIFGIVPHRKDSEGSMARFYLNIKDGSTIITDEEGIDLPNVEAAKTEALNCARWMLADAIRWDKPWVPEALLIADEAGRALAVVPLVAALPEALRRSAPFSLTEAAPA
jgi:hypothetical protein